MARHPFSTATQMVTYPIGTISEQLACRRNTTTEEVKIRGITSRVQRHPQRYTTLDGRPVTKHVDATGVTYELVGQNGEIWHEKPRRRVHI